MADLLSNQLPAVIEQGIAKSADVFCEPGWFTLEQTEEICRESTASGLQIRLHVDEFTDGGGLELAAELGAATADHAIHSSEDARAKAADAGTIQGFLPGTPYVLGSNEWPPIQQCIDEEWPWALSTDFNPNCQILSLPFVGSLAVHRMNIDPIAALAAVTRNPATGISRNDGLSQGVIKEGAVANFNELYSESIDSWCLTPGDHGIRSTWVRGNLPKTSRLRRPRT
jgi:imidazolonepropionase